MEFHTPHSTESQTIRQVSKFALLFCLVIFVYGHTFGVNLPDPYADNTEFVALSMDTIPLEDRYDDYLNAKPGNPFDLKDPNILDKEVEFDPINNQYIVTERIGNEYFRYPTTMTFNEYMDLQTKKQEQAYFNNLTGISNDFMTISGKQDPVEQFDITDDLIDRLFGGNSIEVNPTGNIDITLGAQKQKILNPNITQRQQSPPARFDFGMDINMGLNAKIGEKLDLNFNYNTQSTFNFDNKLNLKFDSEAFSEDDIIKNIEAGDVSLPLKSSLIQGNQSLFGLKTELQFGKLYLTTVISQQQSKQESIQLKEGAQWQEFSIKADEYDQNRHFFLSHYNRETFESSLKNLPQIQSQFKIKRLEVWVTSINNEYQDLRQIVGLTDLGEAEIFTTADAKNSFGVAPPAILLDRQNNEYFPDNTRANTLYSSLVSFGEDAREISQIVPVLEGTFGLQPGRDFEQRRARKLNTNRYTLQAELGLISLDVALRPDEVLAVAYEYTFNGKNYQVGEFSGDVTTFSGQEPDSSALVRSQVLFMKLLKSSTQDVSIPMWDLMMKNVYSIGAYQASEEDFNFDVYYEDPARGIKRFLPEENFNKPLLEVFNLDNLNYYGDPQPDGFFDFVPGLTINTRSGKVMFPVLEPFGSSLTNYLPADVVDKYSYQILYDTTLFVAREFQELNRFVLKGSFKTNVSSEISLGSFNLPPNSVSVRSGGTVLRENIDYTVDYQIGRVSIINDAYLSSGAPINVSFEDRSLFGFNRQSMLGLRADYKLNKKTNIGGTYMKLWERPFTPKVNYGDDPINNAIYGLDFSYSSESPWLTKMVDGIPGIQTKAKSNVDFYAEGALLKPGHSKAINVGDDKGGVVYVDDFEGSATSILLNTQTNRWFMASTPQNHPDFPESTLNNSLVTGSNRALLNWYSIEFNLSSGGTRDLYSRTFSLDDIFPNISFDQTFTNFRTFDLNFYPKSRGPYNFDPVEGTAFSAGLQANAANDDIELKDPKSRWGGIMRQIQNPNFELANVEAIEFWVLNPYEDERAQEGGDLVIHLGNVAEDILKDGQALYENALPENDQSMIPVLETNLGNAAITPPVIFAFANDQESRTRQDVGLDGLNLVQEQERFLPYIQNIRTGFPASIAAKVNDDPSNDDYAWFSDEDVYPDNTPILERYKRYNNPEGNSPVNSGDQRVSNSYTPTPDAEDINQDGSSDKTESYFEYKIPMTSEGNELAMNDFITDVQDNGATGKWYRYKIPINQFTDKYGTINDFRSIRYIRMYLKGFEENVTLRFARFQFTRNSWRKITRSLDNGPVIGGGGDSEVKFDLNVVNVQEHGAREPFGYVLPPGIDQEENFQSSFRGSQLNEQSLALDMCNIPSKSSRGIYKQVNMNMREYERLKMFVHLDQDQNAQILRDGDLTLFMRLGSDYIDNYYEYEIPLKLSSNVTDPDFQKIVWPDSNILDIKLSDFKDLKVKRNTEGASLTANYTDTLFSDIAQQAYRALVSVKGNPNLGLVNTVLIGVRNDSDEDEWCGEVWLNELRLTGLNEQGGAAALARLDLGLADFGTANISGTVSTVGWGAIDKQLLERNREQESSYDMATNLELGKFLPEKSGIKIPFFAQYSANSKKPKYDPYDLDVPLDEKLQNTDSKAERDSIREQALNKTIITTYSFNNVRKERTNATKKPLPWDISNFAASYSYTTTKHSDPILSIDNTTRQTGNLDYRYTTGSKPIEPFKKLFKGDKWIKFIKDFNFNPLPTNFSIRNAMDRKRRDRQFRFAADEFSQAISRQFLWNRDYKLQWNFTKSLKFNYTATNRAAIDELGISGNEIGQDDPFYTGNFSPNTKLRNDYLWNNVKEFGRNKDFSQNFDLSYKIPFSKFKVFDFINADLRYSGNYTWTAAPLNVALLDASDYNTGNTITNGHDESVRVNLNFERLYNKSKYLSAINRGKSSKKKSSRDKETKSDKGGKAAKKSKTAEPNGFTRTLLRPLMLIRKGRFNFTRNYSAYIPGFNQETKALGLSKGFVAPGWDFIAGIQPDIQWLQDHADGTDANWFVDTRLQNQESVFGLTEKWDAQLTIEPVKDFKVDVKMERNFQKTESGLFKFFEGTTEDPEGWDFRGQNEFGSYSISYLATKTLFKDGEDNINALFGTFKDNLSVVSKRVAQAQGIPIQPHEVYGNLYSDGFGSGQQEVIVPSFIAAYADEDPNNVDLDIFKLAPRPNWTLSYNGLSKVGWFKEHFSRITIAHGYKSTLTINSFITDLRFDHDEQGVDRSRNEISTDYYSEFTFPQVVIKESMSPLFRLDFTTKNELTFKFEMGKDRSLSLDPDNQQINEMRGTSWKGGFGFTLKNVYIGWIPGAKKPKQKQGGTNPAQNAQGRGNNVEGNTLKFSCDFALKDDRTVQHSWGLDVTARPTRGQQRVTFSPAIDYTVNKYMTLRMFFDYSMTKPYTSQSYPITNSRGGLRFRFTLN